VRLNQDLSINAIPIGPLFRCVLGIDLFLFFTCPTIPLYSPNNRMPNVSELLSVGRILSRKIFFAKSIFNLFAET
jgi:hypothetical protein